MRRRLTLALAAASVGCGAAGAQSAWSAEAGAGGALHDPPSGRIASTSAWLGMGYQAADRWGYASAGAPLAAGPAWAAAGGGAWLPLLGDRAGLVVGGELFGYGAREGEASGGGAAARLMPTVTLERGRWRAELAAGAAGAVLAEGDSTHRRALGEASGVLVWTVSPAASVTATARHLRGADDALTFAGATAELRRRRTALWGEAGRWIGGEQPAPRAALGVGAALRLGAGTAVALAWRQEPADPLFRGDPRRAWSVVLRRALGAPAPAGVPSPRVVTRVTGDAVTFRLPLREHARAPLLVGDLTGWQPVALVATGEWWTVTVPVRPGVHHYVFRTPAGSWLPPGVPRVSDGFGGFNAVLVVP